MNRAPTPANQMSAEDWSGAMGERWLAHLARFEGMIAPIGEALMAHAAHAKGERVIDVGCGAGGTSIEIARRVGSSGAVFGLDISQALVEAAIRRARAANAQNLQFHCADAATFRLDGPPFDRLFSRFGLMFFAQPVQAFTNLHGLLRRGARADFSVWAPASANAWVAKIMGIVGQYVELPVPIPHAPGPFAFDDPAYLRGVLEQAGFESAQFDTWQGHQLVGGAGASPEEAADFALGVMSFGELLDEANPSARETVQAQLVELFAQHRTSAGIAMDAKAFLVSAHAT
jgi:ubiquinone/menaquinone biosynthesis C-methylase UbiE